MKKNEVLAMTKEDRINFLTEAAQKRKERLEKPDNVKMADRAVYKLRNGIRPNVFEFEALTGIMFSHNMTEKMENILALSTNSLFNNRCIERMQKGDTICAACYAAALALFKKGILENTSYNTIILNERVLSKEIIPDLSEYDELRIEAFGDTGSWICAANYMNIARENPSVHVTAWTKNPDHYEEAIEHGYSKPKNFTLIYSSPLKNVQAKNVWGDLVDHIFTVYTWEYIVENGIPESFINCGGRHCKTCQLCYKYGKTSRFFINELLKSDIKKAEKAGWTFGTETAVQDATDATEKGEVDFSAFRANL